MSCSLSCVCVSRQPHSYIFNKPGANMALETLEDTKHSETRQSTSIPRILFPSTPPSRHIHGRRNSSATQHGPEVTTMRQECGPQLATRSNNTTAPCSLPLCSCGDEILNCGRTSSRSIEGECFHLFASVSTKETCLILVAKYLGSIPPPTYKRWGTKLCWKRRILLVFCLLLCSSVY